LKYIFYKMNFLADGCISFNCNCVKGIKPNKEKLAKIVNESLMLVTALNPHIGYDKSAQIAKAAHKNGTTLKVEALNAGISEKDFNEWVRPEKMLGPS